MKRTKRTNAPPLVLRGAGEKRRLVYDTLNPWLIQMGYHILRNGADFII